jgi:hypothetical protein
VRRDAAMSGEVMADAPSLPDWIELQARPAVPLPVYGITHVVNVAMLYAAAGASVLVQFWFSRGLILGLLLAVVYLCWVGLMAWFAHSASRDASRALESASFPLMQLSEADETRIRLRVDATTILSVMSSNPRQRGPHVLQYRGYIPSWLVGMMLYGATHFHAKALADLSFIPGVTGNETTICSIVVGMLVLGVLCGLLNPLVHLRYVRIQPGRMDVLSGRRFSSRLQREASIDLTKARLTVSGRMVILTEGNANYKFDAREYTHGDSFISLMVNAAIDPRSSPELPADAFLG